MNVVRWWNTARIRNLVASEMAKSLFWLNQENETAAVMEYVPSSEMTVADPGSRLALGKKEGERLDADLSAWSETNDGRQTLKLVAPAFLTPEGKPLMFMGEQKKEWPRLPDGPEHTVTRDVTVLRILLHFFLA